MGGKWSRPQPRTTPLSLPAAQSEMAPILLREDRGPVAILTLNRPRQLNALSGAMIDALSAELRRLETDPRIRVVVLAGSGSAFSAGHDLKELRSLRSREEIHGIFARCCAVMLGLRRLPQPVIARIHGIATAAGCQLVAAADLAVASEKARFATSGINVGLFCSTPAVALSRDVSDKQAFEMLMTGDFIDAARAREIGLVNRVVPESELDGAIADLAGRIIAQSPLALRRGKELFYRQRGMELADAYALASEAMADNMMAEDAAEGIDAFLLKRKPVWHGR